MECTYEALLDAYINPTSLAGTKTGVFVGSGIAEYMAMAFGDPNNMTMHTMSGNSLAVIANRVSYTWDQRGPSLTTDTACSSAMTAFHLGVQALTAGDCSLVSLHTPTHMYLFDICILPLPGNCCWRQHLTRAQSIHWFYTGADAIAEWHFTPVR